jgi:flavin reductase (DIM6/NTAB) family NADH-FMN oxidoreductase RutF
MSLTAEPPQVGVAVNRTVTAHPALCANKFFCVNTLGADHHDLARRFSGPVKGLERFSEGRWSRLSTGAPVLEDAIISLDCRVVEQVELSTHTLFVGAVEAVRKSTDAQPLLFVEGQWASLLHASLKDFDDVMRGMCRSMAAVDSAMAASGDPVRQLDGFVRNYTAVTASERAIGHRSLGAELYISGEQLDRLNAARREFDRKIKAILEQGKRERQFDIEDSAVAAFAISGLIGWVSRWFRPDGRLSAGEVGERLARLVHRMVSVPQRAEPDSAHRKRAAGGSASAGTS